MVLVVVAIIMFGKSLGRAGLVLAFRYPLNTALTVAASLAQIGEFSFILAGLGVAWAAAAEGHEPDPGRRADLDRLNPLHVHDHRARCSAGCARSGLARRLESRDDPLAELPMSTDRKLPGRQVVLVGYGRVGRRIAAALEARGIPYVVAEQNRELVELLRKRVAAVFGDAAEPAVLIQAHIAEAAMLVVATPDPLDVRKMVRPRAR
jgi:CPA2 family monovalent cation:H+ antiporter-2